jgi:hypothetical protein
VMQPELRDRQVIVEGEKSPKSRWRTDVEKYMTFCSGILSFEAAHRPKEARGHSHPRAGLLLYTCAFGRRQQHIFF